MMMPARDSFCLSLSPTLQRAFWAALVPSAVNARFKLPPAGEQGQGRSWAADGLLKRTDPLERGRRIRGTFFLFGHSIAAKKIKTETPLFVVTRNSGRILFVSDDLNKIKQEAPKPGVMKITNENHFLNSNRKKKTQK